MAGAADRTAGNGVAAKRRSGALQARAHELLARVAGEVLLVRVGVAARHLFLLGIAARQAGTHEGLAIGAFQALLRRLGIAILHLLLLRRLCRERRRDEQQSDDERGVKFHDDLLMLTLPARL